MKKKTPKQIRKWLRMQGWYDRYRGHVWHNEASLRERIEVLLGRRGQDTLRSFDWAITCEGRSFWQKADAEFSTWYEYGEE